MKIGLWKRSLLAGALSAFALWPVATYAYPADSVTQPGAGEPVSQFFGGGQQACPLGSGGLVGSAVSWGGLSQLATLGSGGFYGPASNPAYGSNGFGAFGGGFMNFSGGQPSQFATVGGSPYCAGVQLTGTAGLLTNRPCVVRDWGAFSNPGFGFQNIGGFGGGLGGFGGGLGGFGGGPFSPFSTVPFGSTLGAGTVCR